MSIRSVTLQSSQGQLTSKGRECAQTSGGWLIGEKQALSAYALTFRLRVFIGGCGSHLSTFSDLQTFRCDARIPNALPILELAARYSSSAVHPVLELSGPQSHLRMGDPDSTTSRRNS